MRIILFINIILCGSFYIYNNLIICTSCARDLDFLITGDIWKTEGWNCQFQKPRKGYFHWEGHWSVIFILNMDKTLRWARAKTLFRWRSPTLRVSGRSLLSVSRRVRRRDTFYRFREWLFPYSFW